jgi:hypothetical protein
MDPDLARLDVSIHLALALLPALGPEPPLVRRNGYTRMQLDDAVVALDHLYLGASLIEMVPATKPSGKCHRSPGLDADVDGIHGASISQRCGFAA